MAHLISKETVRSWTGQYDEQKPEELPDYFVLFSCGQHEWRLQPLGDWLHQQAILRKKGVIPTSSPVSGRNTG